MPFQIPRSPLFAGLLPALLLALASCQAPAPQRPNILFLITDDQRADALGVAGNPYIQTPNMDRLARSGVRFVNNYCMGAHHGAVCAPSRAMLMSGRSLFNVYDKLDGVVTMPRTLRDQGYLTFGTGKWHNGGASFLDGFEQGKNVFLGGMSDHFQAPVQDVRADGTFTGVQTKGFSTDLFAGAAIDFLTTYAQGDRSRPFFAYVAFTVPHDPRSPAGPYVGRYGDEALPLPPNFLPLHPFNNGDLTVRDEHLGAWPRTTEDIRRQLADYYGLVTHVDARIGDILEALKANGLADNTLIVLTADHGLAIGSHGLLGKQSLYEHSMKAPLILCGPGIPENEVREALVYLYDLFPTLCSLTGIDPPQGVEGRDLSGVIEGTEKQVRSSLFTAYRHTQRAVRDERWKLIRYPSLDYTQLFDLEHDPYELNNLATAPEQAQRVTEMMNLLRTWQQEKNDTLPLTAARILPAAYNVDSFRRVPDRHQPAYTLERFFGGGGRGE